MTNGGLAPKKTSMGNFRPDAAQITALRKEFPKGAKVRLIKMDDPNAPPQGTLGTVSYVDDIGTVHTKWENGSGLGAAFGIDLIELAN